MRLRRSALVLAAIGLTTAFSGTSTAQFDHQKCYRIKDSLPRARYSADLLPNTSPFASELGCEIKVPAKLLCIAVAKTNVSPTPPIPVGGADANDVFCYALRCPDDAAIPRTGLRIEAQDQFGHRDVLVRKAPRLLCAPVNLGHPTATPTPTPTATVPTPTPVGSCVDNVGSCVCPRPASPTPRPTCTAACPTAASQTPAPTPSPPPCGQAFDPPFCSVGTCPFDQTCVDAGAVCACAACCPCP